MRSTPWDTTSTSATEPPLLNLTFLLAMKPQLFRLTRPGLIIALFGTLSAAQVMAGGLSNDDFVNAAVLTGASGTTPGSNIGFGDEANEPTHDGGGTNSAWWKWTAPSTGVVSFNTEGSDFDTVVEVYTGAAVDSLAFVAGNDEAGGDAGDGPSRLSFVAISGTVYHIAVTGVANDEGSIVLNWEPKVFKLGPISIFNRVGSTTEFYYGAEDTTPNKTFFSGAPVTSWAVYVILDPDSDRAAYVDYWTEKVGTVTNKYYQVSLSDYEGNFPYAIIPLRLPNQFQWIRYDGDHATYRNPASPPYLGEGNVQGQTESALGTATPLVLSTAPALSINVPRTITGAQLYNGHFLYSQDDDGMDLGYTGRMFQRNTHKWTDTLDVAKTKAANLTDLTVDGILYPKRSLENGTLLMVQMLKGKGYTKAP